MILAIKEKCRNRKPLSSQELVHDLTRTRSMNRELCASRIVLFIHLSQQLLISYDDRNYMVVSYMSS